MASPLAQWNERKMLHTAYVAFTVNSICLATAFLIYALDWIGHTTQCGQSGVIVTSVTAIDAAFYGLLSAFSTVFIFIYSLRQEISNKQLGLSLLVCSSAAVFLSILSIVVILISLYFRFNTECLHDENSRYGYVYVWVISSLAIATNVIFLLYSILFMNKISKKDRGISKYANYVYTIDDNPKEII